MLRRLRTPVAAFTPLVEEASPTVVAAKAVVPGAVVRRLRLTLCVPPDELPEPEPKANCCRPPSAPGAVAAFVTVMSVPTPYTEDSALACAVLTPAAVAFTTMTSAMASAMPIAMMNVWRRRFESSRRR